MSQLPDTTAWTDEQWIEAMVATSMPTKPRDEAIAIVGEWNRVRECALGQQFAVGMLAAPATDDYLVAEGLARDVVRHPVGRSCSDLVVLAVPPGTGALVVQALRQGLGTP